MTEIETTTVETIEPKMKTKTKTHTCIGIKLTTRDAVEVYRRYERETYDDIILRLIASMESRKGKKEEEA